jgi:hypothetical protein
VGLFYQALSARKCVYFVVVVVVVIVNQDQEDNVCITFKTEIIRFIDTVGFDYSFTIIKN